MGIYRLLDVLARHDPTISTTQITAGHKRIVICYPPYNYHMDPSDMVRCILFDNQTIHFWYCCFSSSSRYMLCNNHDRILVRIHEKTPCHYLQLDDNSLHNHSLLSPRFLSIVNSSNSMYFTLLFIHIINQSVIPTHFQVRLSQLLYQWTCYQW